MAGSIALTFDDGPHGQNTPDVLDTLERFGVRATFFVVGRKVERFPDLVRRMALTHEVGNHSWSHQRLAMMAPDEVRSELRRTHDVLEATTGQAPTLMRPPFGSLTREQAGWIVEEFAYRIIRWNFHVEDWKDRTPAFMTDRLVEGARDGLVVLLHDVNQRTANFLEESLRRLLDAGFRFATVSEMDACP